MKFTVWNKIKKVIMRYPENHGELLKDNEEPEKPDCIVCPNCGSNQWYEGPSGGMSTNIKCGGCGIWFNSTPFGLDYIGIKENIGETRKIRWYCPHCNDILDFGKVSQIFKYPTCPFCETPLKVCWTYKKLPHKFCDTCLERFRCFTKRGNF